MQGMSQGTALAAMLRPLGLGFAPHREIGGKVSLKIGVQQDLRELWPVGWPVDKPGKTAPDLYRTLNVEIANTSLAESLSAIQGRLSIPFLFDHNKMERERIDPAAVNASFPAKRTFYNKIINHLLFQAKLKSELRVDEADQPFLWITTVRP
jgi:hypothetical protein